MTLSRPRTLESACRLLRDDPDASLLGGGTDYMVEVNFNHRSPKHVVSLRDVDEIRTWQHDPTSGRVLIGASVTMATLERPEFSALAPALAQAARTVGSPQIRAAATLGGNVGTASPAGDTLPVLSALDAIIHVASHTGRRTVSVHDFFTGPKRTTLVHGEIIAGIEIPVANGPQNYAKVGVRNAMVISIASACIALQDESTRISLGSVGPTVLRCPDAESFIDGIRGTRTPTDDDYREFSARVATASRPIDDHRSTAEYRRHAIGVLAGRLARRSLSHVP